MISRQQHRYAVAVALVALCVLAFSGARAQALAPGTGWEAGSSLAPTNLPPGGSGEIQLDIINTGAKPSEGSITVTDTLPPGVTATAAGGMFEAGTEILTPEEETAIFGGARWVCTGNGPGKAVAGASAITCTSEPAFLPSLPVRKEREIELAERIGIAVKIDASHAGISLNQVTVSGGGASRTTTASDPVTISSSQPGFGFSGWDVWFTNADGTSDTQAGSHPYAATFFLGLNELAHGEPPVADGEVRNLEVDVPPGLFADLNAVPRCTRTQLDGIGSNGGCPPQTQIGIDVNGRNAAGGGTGVFETNAVYNMVPPPGVPVEFAFSVAGFHAFFDAGVRNGGGYGVVEHVENIPHVVALDQNILTLWGVPQEASHDAQRKANGNCEEGCSSGLIPRPFLTLPTSCEGPQPFTIRGLATWQDPNAHAEATVLTHDDAGLPTGFTGCGKLSMAPSLSAVPETAFADTPTGLTADLKLPQETLTEPHGLVSSTIKNATVTLPEGVVVNPGQAAGLVACQEAQADVHGEGPSSCPPTSKVGTVKIKTPLLEGTEESELEGSVYVLQSNPPNLQLLVTASADGVNLKLVGNVHLNEATGQITTTFTEAPELPFTDFKLSFSGGVQAALATPTGCGTYTTTSDFTPWATPFGEDVLSSSSFQITNGPGGGGCASPLPFSPSMVAGATNDQAGGFTNFSLLLQRADGQQRISRLQFKAPQGLSAIIAQVPLCGEQQAAQGTCPASSQIGHTVVASGPGPFPLIVPEPGRPEAPIYLTGPYKGAPFGLSIVTPVIAGPFNLGTIVTRASIAVDPNTAQITVTTDPLPQIIDGVPTDLRTINAVIDRPSFMFNPTSCNPQEFNGAATSSQGASAPISSRFQVGSCRGLEFAPKFSVSTSGKTSKANGASLVVKVTQKPGEANIHKVSLQLPLILPARLTTLQKACTEAQFNANPAGCPVASVIGAATAITPVLNVPLTGPAYLVSHGGAAFPDVEFVLQGQGVTIVLDGKTDIKKGITYSRFETVPDAPIDSFETNLPEGPHSALTANGDLCAQTRIVTVRKRVTRRVHGRTRRVSRSVREVLPPSLSMPTTIVGQNGAQVTQTTKIAVTGCAKSRHRAHGKGKGKRKKGKKR
jgi:hypothetical protein